MMVDVRDRFGDGRRAWKVRGREVKMTEPKHKMTQEAVGFLRFSKVVEVLGGSQTFR